MSYSFTDAHNYITPAVFDIFESTREFFYDCVVNSTVAGVVATQVHAAYNHLKPSQDSHWSQTATMRLEKLVRTGAVTFDSHLATKVPDYLKKVFEQQQQQQPGGATTTVAAALTREQKLARVINASTSRLSTMVIAPVLFSYLFSLEMVLVTIVHPIALHRENEFNGSEQSLHVLHQQQHPLMGQPPFLELCGSLASPAAENDNDDDNNNDEANTTNNNNNDNKKQLNEMLINLLRAMKSRAEDVIDASLSSRGVSVPLGIKSRIDTDDLIGAVGDAVSDGELYTMPPPNLEWVVEMLFPSATSGNSDGLLTSEASSDFSSLFGAASVRLPDRNVNRRNDDGSGKQESGVFEQESARRQLYYSLLNGIVENESFRSLVQLGAEQLFRRVVAPAMRGAFPKCKTFEPAPPPPIDEQLRAQQQQHDDDRDGHDDDSTTAAPAAAAAVSTHQQQRVGTAGSVLFSHLAASLSNAVVTVSQPVTREELFPELFGPEAEPEEEGGNFLNDLFASALNGGQPTDAMRRRVEQRQQQRRARRAAERRAAGLSADDDNNDDNDDDQNDDAAEEDEETEEQRMQEKMQKSQRRFRAFPSLRTYGGHIMNFARGAIEINIGSGFGAEDPE